MMLVQEFGLWFTAFSSAKVGIYDKQWCGYSGICHQRCWMMIVGNYWTNYTWRNNVHIYTYIYTMGYNMIQLKINSWTCFFLFMEFLTLQLGKNWNITMLERDLWHENNHREIIGIVLTCFLLIYDCLKNQVIWRGGSIADS